MSRLLNILTKIVGSLFLCVPLSLNAFSVSLNELRELDSIGSLDIDGILFDVSFDGTFGESLFIGDIHTAEIAILTIRGILNSSRLAYVSHLRVATDAKTVFTIAFSDTHAFQSSYGAGWTCCGAGRTGIATQDNRVTFREAIPGSIPDDVPQVPLPASGWLFMSALAGVLGRKHLSRH